MRRRAREGGIAVSPPCNAAIVKYIMGADNRKMEF